MKHNSLVVGPLPIEAITRVGRMSRPPYHRNECRSRPGHLIHLVNRGGYHLTMNGREYLLNEGDVVYYHDGEDVIWQGIDKPVTFTAIGFFAPGLAPPPEDKRHFHSTPIIRQEFERAIESERNLTSLRCSYALYSCLLRILSELPVELGSPGQIDTDAKLWWELERTIRCERRFRASMTDLTKLCGMSESSIVRSCRKATRLSPMKRLKALRLDTARGYLSYTDMNVSEVAQRLGYPRMHEFSREFSQHYGMPPSQLIADRSC